MSEFLNPLLILLELEASGSLAVAANRLGRTPSSLSKLIRQLEAQLGRPLVEHGSRPLSLTASGHAYVEAARMIRDELRETETRIHALDTRPGGRLRVTSSVLFGNRVLADYLVAYRRRYPDVQVEVVLTDDFVDVSRDDFDLAIRHAAHAGPHLIARAIAENRVRLCATPDYYARHGRPSSPADLARHQCLNYRADSIDSRWRFIRGTDSVPATPVAGLTCNSDDFLYTLMREGECLLPCFEWAAREELAAGTIESCLDDWRFESAAFGDTQLWAVYPRGRRGQAKVTCFVSGLVELLAKRREALYAAAGYSVPE